MTDALIIQLIAWLIGQFVAAAAIWGAIKADLRHLHQLLDLEREDRLRDNTLLRESMTALHRRLDGGARAAAECEP